jgi:hypothetical protein
MQAAQRASDRAKAMADRSIQARKRAEIRQSGMLLARAQAKVALGGALAALASAAFLAGLAWFFVASAVGILILVGAVAIAGYLLWSHLPWYIFSAAATAKFLEARRELEIRKEAEKKEAEGVSQALELDRARQTEERRGSPFENVTHLDWNDYYAEYLKSKAWKRVRGRVLKAADYKCARCGARATQVHHKRYPKNMRRQKMSYLEALCRKCHRQEHNKL